MLNQTAFFILIYAMIFIHHSLYKIKIASRSINYSVGKFFGCIFFFLVILHVCGSAQGFEMTFGGPGTQICNDIALGEDSAIYMLGYTSTGTVGGNDFMLSKITLSGQHIWTRNLGTLNDDFGYSVIYKPGQKLVLAGNTYDSLMGTQVMLIVTDTSGIEISRYFYGSPETEIICDANPTPDNGYVICGYQSVSGTNYVYVLKLDSVFNEQWAVSYGAGINDYANETIMTNDSTYFVSADRKINLGGGQLDYDNCILQLDDMGQLVWDSVYTVPFQNGGQGVIEGQSGNIVFFGETEIYQFSPFDFFISAVSPLGEQLWSYTFGGAGTDALFDVLQDSSGDFVGTGYSNSASNGIDPLNVALIKMDTLGNLLWQREYGFPGIDMGYTILEAPGGGYLVGGRATTTDDDFYLLKTDLNGLTGTPESAGSISVSVYPNPCSDFLAVNASATLYGITIFDSMGREIYKNPGSGNAVTSYRINVDSWAPGIYFSELNLKNGSVHRFSFVKN